MSVLAGPIHRAMTPRALQQEKLTIPKAIDQWCETTLAIQGLEPIRDRAAEFLIANARKTGRRQFKGRIAVMDTGGQRVLDQAEVRAELGDRISDDRFWKRAKRGLALKLLRSDDGH